MTAVRTDEVVIGAGGLCAAARLALAQAKILSIRVMPDDWPAQRSCAGCDLPRETGIDGLWCFGDAVKQYGNGGTQTCAETAKIVTYAILAQRPRMPQAGQV